MLQAHQLLGLPVMVRDTGEQLGIVQDLCLDEDWQVLGLLVELDKGLLRPVRLLKLSSVLEWGEDALMVEQGELEEIPPGTYTLRHRKRGVKGLPVLTRRGKELGRLEDVYFLEEVGTIIGYEVSEGWIQDLRQGRKILRRPRDVVWGEEGIILPDPESGPH